jgi:O-antigen ligase
VYDEASTSVAVPSRANGRRERLRTWSVALVLALIAGLSASDPKRVKYLVAAPALLLALTIPAETLFAVWLFAAPFVQGAAAGGHRGHAFFKYLFLAPPLVLGVRLALGSGRVPRLRFVDVLPALYLAFILVSVLLFKSPDASAQHSSVKSIYIALGGGILAYYFMLFLKPSPRFAELVCSALIWSAIPISILTVVDGVTRWNLWHNVVSDYNGTLWRAVSTFTSPEEVGTFIGAVVAFAVAILLWDGPRSLKAPSVALIAVAIPALYFTYTRGPVLAIGLVVAAMILTARRARLVGLVGLLVAGIVVIASWGFITSTHIYKDRFGVTQTATPRVALSRVSLDLFWQRPLFGHGYATFDQVKLNLPAPPGDAEFVRTLTSHDTYLTVLAETGIVGLALLVVPWIVISWRALVEGRAGRIPAWLVGGSVGATVSFAIGAATYDARFFPLTTAIPWIALGLVRRQLGESDGGDVVTA